MREAFALQKLITFFNKNFWQFADISILNFNEMLTNEVVSFEQLGPALFLQQIDTGLLTHVYTSLQG